MSAPTTRYDIITSDSDVSLVQMVNERLALGWRLQGGVSVALSETDEFRYVLASQAMTLDTAPTST